MLRMPPISPSDIEAYLISDAMNVIAGIVILLVGWWLSARLAKWTKTALDRVQRFDETLKPLITSVVRYIVLLAAIIAVLERFGVETTSLITLLGTAGLAVGLALQGTLSNVASGVMLLVLRPFRVGDWVTVTAASQSGKVREIGLFTTILITADQAYVSLPNASIFSSAIVNASREPISRLNFTVCVDAASDVDAALNLIADTLSADHRILKTPAPATGVVSLKEYSVELLMRCWVRNADSEAVKFDVQKSIRERFRRADIQFPVQRHLMEQQPSAAAAPQRQHIGPNGHSC